MVSLVSPTPRMDIGELSSPSAKMQMMSTLHPDAGYGLIGDADEVETLLLNPDQGQEEDVGWSRR